VYREKIDAFTRLFFQHSKHFVSGYIRDRTVFSQAVDNYFVYGNRSYGDFRSREDLAPSLFNARAGRKIHDRVGTAIDR
jgi:hypothetical protein